MSSVSSGLEGAVGCCPGGKSDLFHLLSLLQRQCLLLPSGVEELGDKQLVRWAKAGLELQT